nr:hypothetical protein [Oceanococcus sp. HetDA_MAG_MS8]
MASPFAENETSVKPTTAAREGGATAAEYALIAAMVAVGVAASIGPVADVLGEQMARATQTVQPTAP